MCRKSVKRWMSTLMMFYQYSSKVDLSVAASEEMEKPHSGKFLWSYTLLYDPIDGSSNTDTNLSLGSIFHSPGRE